MYSFSYVYIDDLDLMKLSQLPLINLPIPRPYKIGGTWLENRYPGCAYDVPAHNRIAYLAIGFIALEENGEGLTGYLKPIPTEDLIYRLLGWRCIITMPFRPFPRNFSSYLKSQAM
jgi:hypothetical protein